MIIVRFVINKVGNFVTTLAHPFSLYGGKFAHMFFRCL
jgi:hypothetical protein